MVVSGPNGEEYAWYQCTVSGGREGRQIGAVEELGAGEILLNCIDCDGIKNSLLNNLQLYVLFFSFKL
ncbi:hypothetical protein Pint_04093 [Pistacia integerrima]|uniref:Uncharacterized protein n=1 Tax=Pistacia integerrima TaxID=434235 RepID=A0ACC0Z9Q5_9ROSI|nr:hypothetical protein Pint_04093 [Pistacia integerrima]